MGDIDLRAQIRTLRKEYDYNDEKNGRWDYGNW